MTPTTANINQEILEHGAIEFYGHHGIAHAIIDGTSTPLKEWPIRVIDMIMRDIDRHPGAEEALETIGLHKPIDKVNQYTICMYGELNMVPDFINFKRNASDAEFVQLICGNVNCSYRGVLCNLIHAVGGQLTDREVIICQLLAENNSCQDIADALGISINTVNTHITNILPKVGVKNSKAVAAWAAKNLIK